MFNNNDNNNKKMPEILNDNNVLKQVIFFGFYLVFFIILLIITVVVINIIWNGSKSSDKQTTNDTSRKLASTQNAIITSDTSKETNSGLEERLKNILSKSNIPITNNGANTTECQLNPDGYHTQSLINEALVTVCNVSTNII